MGGRHPRTWPGGFGESPCGQGRVGSRRTANMGTGWGEPPEDKTGAGGVSARCWGDRAFPDTLGEERTQTHPGCSNPARPASQGTKSGGVAIPAGPQIPCEGTWGDAASQGGERRRDISLSHLMWLQRRNPRRAEHVRTARAGASVLSPCWRVSPFPAEGHGSCPFPSPVLPPERSPDWAESVLPHLRIRAGEIQALERILPAPDCHTLTKIMTRGKELTNVLGGDR